MAQVTLIGMGTVGNALGMALRRYANAPETAGTRFTVVGTDTDTKRLAEATRTYQSVDRVIPDLRAAVHDAAFVIITLPTRQMRQTLADIAPHLAQGAIVSDTAGTKGIVLRWAAELLPAGVSFVGGHPVPRRTAAGADEITPHPDLYKGGLYCILPLPSASEAAVNQVISLAGLLGAQPYFVDPLEHDSFMAAIQHMPTLVSANLLRTAGGSAVWRELAPLAGGGFRDATRLAETDPMLLHDELLANREPLLHWLDRYLIDLADMREWLINLTDPDPEVATAAERDLRAALHAAHQTRTEWIGGANVTDAASLDAALHDSLHEASTRRVTHGLFGGWLMGRVGQGPEDEASKDRRK